VTIHNQQRYRDIQVGDVVAIEHNWVKSFALMPHKTIGKKYIWLKKCYVRRVWVYTGFIDEPETQYGNLIDVIKTL
jgi:hypothetical protein